MPRGAARPSKGHHPPRYQALQRAGDLPDGHPVPKVIDFGFAKATTSRLTEKTLFTEFPQMIGTPAYMSPEQAELSGLDVDTRSDIYSLGVMLYELLTGSTPLDVTRMKTAAYDEIRQIIREEEPAKPSSRISAVHDTSTTVAAQRKTNVLGLRQRLRGELDWIVMKALEKDRTRRYRTADQFAADVQRHLSGEAVEACPPSARYRLSKFVRRYKTQVAVVSFAFTMLLGSTLLLWGLFSNAQRDRIRAKNAESIAVAAKADAERNFDRAEKSEREHGPCREIAATALPIQCLQSEIRSRVRQTS